jgi:IPT/TIG domain
MRATVVFTLLVVCALALGATAQTTFTSQVRPVITEYDDWAHFSTRDWVEVKGCGFQTYSHVVCLWDFRWSSFASYIVSDNLIVCQVPELAKEDFKSLPYWTRLDVVFDGNLYDQDMYAEVTTGPYELRAGPFRFGPALDCDAPLVPNFGRIGGGDTVQIVGEGFQDNWDTVDVYFDNMMAPSTSVSSDTVLSVTTPAGQFDQNAMVTVVFNQDLDCYLHSKDTFHYGPIPQKILPPCTYEYGGTPLFIEGELMGDFTPGLENTPGRVFVEIAELSLISMNDKNRFIGVEASVVTSLEDSTKQAISFVAPSPASFSFGSSNTWGNVIPHVRVHWRQVDADSLSLTQSYKYGAIVFNNDNPWETSNSGTNPLVTSTRDAGSCTHNEDLDFPSLPGGHLDGGDQVCVRGCGFHNFTGETGLVDVFLDSSNWCGVGTKSIGFLAGTSGSLARPSEEVFCCTTISTSASCAPDAFSALDVRMEFIATSGLELEPATPLDVLLGPLVDLDQDTRGPVDGGDLYVVTGRFFHSSGDSSVIDSWGTLLTDFPDADVVSDPSFTVTSDCTADLVVPEATFDLDSFFRMDFDSTRNCDGLPDDNELRHHWGPRCTLALSSEEEAIDLKVGPLSGAAQFSVEGVGFLESGMQANNIELGMCLTRKNSGGQPCQVAEDVSNSLTSVSDSSATATTLTLWEDVVTDEGGQRLWGDHSLVYMFFPENRTTLTSIFFDGTTAADSRDSYLLCGTYRFGPVITGLLDSCKGPTAPVNTTQSITAVQLLGLETLDQWYPNPANGAFDQALNPDRVTFGTVFGVVPTTSTQGLSTATMWGGVANSDVSVTGWFATCNVTAPWTTRDIKWGPTVYEVYDSETRLSPLVKVTEDLFGFKPWDTSAVITVRGQGFEAYCSDKWQNAAGPCSGTYESLARCIIDGVKVPARIVRTGPVNSADFHIECDTPARPFGSRALVSVEFGRPCAQSPGATATPGISFRHTFQSGLVKSTPESGWTEDEVDWSRVLSASNYIWYRPLILRVEPESGKTSGGQPITVHGEGFLDWDTPGVGALQPADYSLWVGQYMVPVSAGMVTELTITATTPSYSAEFNTVVPVAVELPARNETTDMFPVRSRECVDDLHDWRVVLDSAYRYGPTCTGVAENYGSMGGFESTSTDVFTLTGSDFRDCDECTEASVSCSSSLWNSRRTQPYAPNQVTADDRGSTKCIHRKVEYLRYSFDFYGNNGDSSLLEEGPFNPISNDTFFGNTDSTIILESERTPSGRPCPLRVYYGLYFPDALVSTEAQRTILCFQDDLDEDDMQIFGPTWNSFTTSDWFNDVGDTLFEKTSYGWVGDDVTLNFFNLGDPYVDCPDCTPNFGSGGSSAEFIFHSNTQIGGSATGPSAPIIPTYVSGVTFSGDYDVNTGAPRTISVEAPSIGSASASWNQYRRMRLSFTQSWPGNGSACNVDASLFHYGPVLTAVTDETVCSPLRVRDGDNEAITISGRAFGCCGFEMGSSVGNSPSTQDENIPLCVMPSHFSSVTYDNDTLQVTDAPGSALSTAVCVTPFNDRPGTGNNNDVNQAIWAFGLSWNNTAGNQQVLTRAEDGSVFSHCYGPRQTESTYRLRYSGFPSSTTPLYDTHDLDNYATVSITGQNLDDNTGIFESVPMCEWIAVENGNDVLLRTTGGTPAGWLCPVHKVFWKRCQDPADFVSLVFNSTDTGEPDYRELEVSFPVDDNPTSQPNPRWISQSGNRVLQTVNYGPVISAVDTLRTVGTEDEMPQAATTVDLTHFYTWEDGGLDLSVTLLHFEDWLTEGEPDASMGTETVLPLFGNRRHGPFSSSVTGVPPQSGTTFDLFSAEDYLGAALALPGTGVVDVRVPPNGFGVVQELSVLFDPHADLWTTLFSPEEWNRAAAGTARETDYWHWTPYANAVSRSWVSPRGYEELVVSGGGFCAYSAVVCLFDGAQGEGDIVADNKVVCRTAPSDLPNTATVQLRFCDTFNNPRCDCSYGCDQSPDDVTVTDGTPDNVFSLAYYGISDVTLPSEGPHYGDTVVEFPNVGLTNFDRITCQWGGSPSGADASFSGQSGNGTSNTGALTCVTPSVGSVTVEAIFLSLYWNTGGNNSYTPYANSPIWEIVRAPNSFDFGEPTVTRLLPTTTDVDMSGVQTVVVEGRYFNAGDAFGAGNKTQRQTTGYRCHWFDVDRTLVENLAAVAKEPVNRDGIDTFNLVCPTPTLNDALEVGVYQLEVQWDGSLSIITTDYNLFRLTQNPLISNYTVDSENDDDQLIGELGAIVTLVGNNFNNGKSDQYYSRWESLSGEDEIVQTGCNYIDSEHVQCAAPPRNMTFQLAMRRDVNVFLSLDGGASFSEPFTTTYEGDPDAVFCLDSAAALSVSALLAVLVALFAVLF